MDDKFKWTVHTPNLLKEILECNPGMGTLKIPIQIFRHLLNEVGKRAVEINDPKLNCLMIRLTLYDDTEPGNENYSIMQDYLKTHENNSENNQKVEKNRG